MVLVAAIAMGVLAAYVLRGYVNDQEAKANPDPVKVYMITQKIERGQPFSAALGIKETTMPKKYQPATFVSDLKSLDKKVAATDLAPNQVLVDNMFVSSEILVTGLSEKLVDGMVAIAVPIEGVRALGGLLQPGDKVNIMVLPKPAADGAAAATEGAAGAAKPAGAAAGAIDPTLSPYLTGARYLYQQVRIISIGTSVRASASDPAVASTAASNTLTQSGGSIVFEVPPDAAQIIASIDPSTLYLTLTKKTYEPTKLAPLDPASVKSGAPLPGEDPAKLTPYSGVSGAAPTTTKAN